jgi:hypothetical protein
MRLRKSQAVKSRGTIVKQGGAIAEKSRARGGSVASFELPTT